MAAGSAGSSRARDLSAKNNVGWTPLHGAAFQGHYAVAQLLLAKGADVSAQDIDGDTPEALATLRANKHILAMLKAEALRRARCEAFAMGHHEPTWCGW
ncbi:hypothetical protein T484DRAFT_1768075 [Baffinella frigidus]|nr:hypothetical protein T484DRAFT_1768075 [Cryptophyta sp. CCMP2293]